MDSKQLDILNNLEDSLQSSLDAFQKDMPKINDELFNELSDLIGKLKKSSNGNIATSIENLKIVNKINTDFDKIIQDSNYSDSVKEFVQGFKDSNKFTNEYFSTIATSFKANNELYRAILDSNINTTIESLLGSGINANFKEPIINSIRQNVISGTNSIALRKSLEDQIKGTKEKDALLMRYTKQVSSDTIHQYNANYFQAISKDLDLQYYYYKGTKIDDTRPFCAARAGKYFTKAEVEAWTDHKWAGEIPGTDKFTIFTYRGGYNCRHLLIPVSKALYDKFKSR